MTSCSVIPSAPQSNFNHYKPNDVITSNNLLTSEFTSLKIINRIRAPAHLNLSGSQFQFSWRKIKPFSSKWEESCVCFAFSAASEGCNLVRIDAEEDNLEKDEFIVVNFYHFVFIEHPEEEVSKHLAYVQVLPFPFCILVYICFLL